MKRLNMEGLSAKQLFGSRRLMDMDKAYFLYRAAETSVLRFEE
jgi:hypothetical protein